ncbi:MAG: sensor histidine kinase, partial [Polaromonas sp.]|nr:sensor histidine kinase [Polaromonas sp.]
MPVPQNFGESTLLGSQSQGEDEAAPHPAPRASVFDTCQVGVILRVVLFIETVAGVDAMFEARAPLDWMLRFALLTGGVLPATLVWLVVVCSLKSRLNRLAPSRQWLSGIVLGALAGLYGCGLLAMIGLLQPAPWWASAAAGALLSGVVLARQNRPA